MKNFSLGLFITAILSAINGFGQTDSLRITFDATQAGSGCQPIGASSMFMHSGVGTSATTYYDFPLGIFGPDTSANGDTIGKMKATAIADVWQIVISPRSYYSQAPNGPIPQSDSLYHIAMIFINHDGTMEGKDDNCEDIYIEDLYTANPFVTNKDGTAFSGVSAEWVGATGIKDISSSIEKITAFPNPVKSSITINYSISENIDDLKITGMDAMGRNIATLHNGSQVAGDHQVIWDASNMNSGVYFYTFSNGESMITKKLMVVK